MPSKLQATLVSMHKVSASFALFFISFMVMIFWCVLFFVRSAKINFQVAAKNTILGANMIHNNK